MSADDGLDRQGTFWRAMYRRGERFEDASPLPRLPRWNWLANYGKLHPIIGSALQAAVWGLLMLPFFLIFALAGLPLFVVLCFDAGAAVLFGLLVGGYNLYASRHGEPWAQR